MKAILEIEMPESCRECALLFVQDSDCMDRCILTCSLVAKTQSCRNVDCPLKPIEQ